MELLEVATDGLVRTVSLTSAHVTIGRGEDNDVVLPGDARVSRTHAMLSNVGGVWNLTDRGSTNGTYVNSVLVTKPIEVRLGDRISIGSSVIELTTDESATALHRFGDLDDAMSAGDFRLSVADRQLLSLVANGATDHEIASILNTTPEAAAAAVAELAARTAAPRRIDLARLATRLGAS